MPVTIERLLCEAADAVATRRWDTAAASLLTAWSVSPYARVAQAIAQLDTRLPTPEPLEGKRVRDREAHWHELAEGGDHERVRRALASEWPAHPKEAAARVAVLAQSISARVSNALLAMHRRSQYNSPAGRRLSREIFGLLLALGDESAVQDVERLERVPSEAQRLGRELLRRPRAALEPLSPASEAALSRIEEALSGERPLASSPRETLLAAVYAEPYDDGPRMVFADLLTAAGEPRGEFITLQLQGASPKRQEALLRAAGRAWLDGLDGDGAVEVVHRRGFPAQATLSAGQTRVPAWATVETLKLAGDGTFAGGSHLRAIRILSGLNAKSLATATVGNYDLDLLVVVRADIDLPVDTPFAPRVLGFYFAHIFEAEGIVRRISGSPLARRLDAVRLVAHVNEIGPAIRLARGLPFSIELNGGWDFAKPAGWSVRLTNTTLRLAWHEHERDDASFESVVAVLDMLGGSSIERLEVSGDAPAKVQVQQALIRIIRPWSDLRSADILGEAVAR